jgi:GTP-binding protein HflX
LERQKGGIGLRGPGETQLETDRRLLRARIDHILRRLAKVSKQREQGRRARRRVEIPTVSLVGYTNAGKSTLFNQITNAGVYAADQLFATLDPTLRKLDIEDVGPTILADTVGFIRHLPHDLVAAFKATLQETQEAELLLHVVDVADERLKDNIYQVNHVLAEIDASEVPVLMVYNKIDLVNEMQPRIERDDEGAPIAVWLSAQQGVGIELLFEALTERLSGTIVEHTLRLPPQLGRLRGMFYQLNCVQKDEFTDEGGWLMTVRLPSSDWHRLVKHSSESIESCICH